MQAAASGTSGRGGQQQFEDNFVEDVTRLQSLATAWENEIVRRRLETDEYVNAKISRVGHQGWEVVVLEQGPRALDGAECHHTDVTGSYRAR